MRLAIMAIIVLGAAVGLASVYTSGASAATLTRGASSHQVLLASTTPSPTARTTTAATATATPKPSATATVASVPKTGGPPTSEGTSPFVYLLIALGGLTLMGGTATLVKVRTRP
ncbi:MAG: hypothetical protein ABI559_13560 [Chloroflexota bacterium]